MNILLTSVGRRSYLVSYFKKALDSNGEVHVANSSDASPAFLVADHSVVSPLIYNSEYIPFLKNYCIQNKIDIIVSLFDIDLPILAKYKEEFQKIGVRVIVSSEEVINVCNDKWKTFEYMSSKGFCMPKTYITIDSAYEALRKNVIKYPVIVKPRWGMGSIGVYEAENDAELTVLYNKTVSNIKRTYLHFESEQDLNRSVIIQEKLSGQEYGLDVINNLNGSYRNTIVKKKIAMRAGETDCAETINDYNLISLGEKIANTLHHIANLDVDVFLCNDKAFILEMNARFGGGYPFSHMAGVDLPKAIVKWIKNEEVPISMLTAEIGVCCQKDLNLVQLK